jgi:hypothetical protein
MLPKALIDSRLSNHFLLYCPLLCISRPNLFSLFALKDLITISSLWHGGNHNRIKVRNKFPVLSFDDACWRLMGVYSGTLHAVNLFLVQAFHFGSMWSVFSQAIQHCGTTSFIFWLENSKCHLLISDFFNCGETVEHYCNWQKMSLLDLFFFFISITH